MKPGGSTPDRGLRPPTEPRRTTKAHRRARNLERRIAAGGGGGDGTSNVEIDGRGTFIQSGVELDWVCDFDATITGWKLMADASGSISLDLRKAAFASFPPGGGDTIVAAAPPALASAQTNSDTVLTGWTTAITAGDVIRVHVTSCSGISRICLAIHITRTS